MDRIERKKILEDIEDIDQYHIENDFATYVVHPKYIEIYFDGKSKRITEAELNLYKESNNILILKVYEGDNQL